MLELIAWGTAKIMADNTALKGTLFVFFAKETKQQTSENKFFHKANREIVYQLSSST